MIKVVILLFLLSYVQYGWQVQFDLINDVQGHKQNDIDEPKQAVNSMARVDKRRNGRSRSWRVPIRRTSQHLRELFIRILRVKTFYLLSVCGEDGHIDERGAVIIRHLESDGVEVVGADDSIAAVDEEVAEEDDEEDEGTDDGLGHDPAVAGR